LGTKLENLGTINDLFNLALHLISTKEKAILAIQYSLKNFNISNK
jgi:hypothetical protein